LGLLKINSQFPRYRRKSFGAVTKQSAAKILATDMAMRRQCAGDAHIGGNVSRGLSSTNGR
jgi:hypothetical protein